LNEFCVLACATPNYLDLLAKKIEHKRISQTIKVHLEAILSTLNKLLSLLDHVLCLNGRALTFTLETPLLGSVPELDSMAVVSLLTAMEEQFGFTADDDDIDGSTFATVGSIVDFVESRLGK